VKPAASLPSDRLPAHRAARTLAMTVLVVLAVVTAQLYLLQIHPAPKVVRAATTTGLRPPYRMQRSLVEQGGRSGVYDRMGRPLALSWYEQDLVVDPLAFLGLAPPVDAEDRPAFVEKALARLDSRVPRLAAVLASAGIPLGEAALRNQLVQSLSGGRGGAPRRWLRLHGGIPPQTLGRLHAALARARLAGLGFEPRIRRTYPGGSDFSQVVGILAESPLDAPERQAGRTALEWAADRAMEGRAGAVHAELDRLGREFFAEAGLGRPVRAGADVHLTLDAIVQRICMEELERGFLAHRPALASAVVLSVADATVLAAATWPSADPEALARPGEVHKLRLAALLDRYEPGSTIKPLFFAWALQTGRIRMDSVFDCGGADGVEQFGPRVVREYSANPEPLSVEMILVRSSNVGAVRVGLDRLGLDGLYEALQAFKVAKEPGLGFPYAAGGGYTRRDAATLNWTGVSLCQGYEITFSPFGLARLYLTFARGGEWVEPAIFQELVRGEHRESTPPPEARGRTRVLDPAVAQSIRQALRRAVEEGTGRSARSERWSVAAKTGTPRFKNTSTYNPVMCAMAPAQAPAIVVVVQFRGVQRRGSEPYTGGGVAGPVVKCIVERTLAYLDVPEEPGRTAARAPGR
jgi:cell division protein FtsI (penicillin-binding protein 3)